MMAACSSDDVIEEVKPIVESTDPMRFSNVIDNYQTRTNYSIPNLLKQGFMVSCYKNFGESNQQEVMPQYEVNYEQYESWYGETVSWNYISAESGHQFYQEQFQKYWDFSAYPYRFNAISPAPLTSSNTLPVGFKLNDKAFTMPTPFQYQTSKDGVTTPSAEIAEPCMVAQVERRADGRDYDLLARNSDGTSPLEINNSNGYSRVRTVALPFHHLNCKVRFGIYCPVVGEGDNHEISDVKIKVRSNNFITSAKYESENKPTLTDGTFTEPVKSNEEVILLELTPSAELHGNDMCFADSRDNAYFFECPLGLMQIPQEGVQISISFLIRGRFADESSGVYIGEFTQFTDVPVVLQDTREDTFNWEKNHYYTYFIQLGEFRTTDPIYPIIIFTCTEEPWDEVTGSFNASLED